MSDSKLTASRFYSLRTKFAGSVLAVFIVIYSLSMKYSYEEREDAVLLSAKQESKSTVQIIAATLYRNYSLEEDQREILSYIKGIQNYKNVIQEISVINTDSEIIASNRVDTIFSKLTDKKISAVFHNQMGLQLNPKKQTIDIDYPISAELNDPAKKVFGAIRVKVSLATQFRQLATIQENIILTAIFIAATIGIVVIYLAYSITKPLSKLTGLLGQVNRGNLSVRSDITSKDELGFLGESFNGMVVSLNESNEKNERYAKSLEESNQQLNEFNKAAARFVPSEFLHHLAKDDLTQVQLGDAVLRDMTVLFLDIRNFTQLSEQMDESDNLSFVNALLKRLNPEIAANNGFIDKFIGDAVMALFPKLPDDALRAAITMRERLQSYNSERVGHHKVAIDFGIGINTGPLILGTVGSPSRMDTTVIGKTVNLASRMEGLTKTFATPIIVSEASYKQLRTDSAALLDSLGQVSVKGIRHKVHIYYLLGEQYTVPAPN